MRSFATNVDFNISSKLQATKLTKLAHGDKTRIRITKLWQRKTRLKSSSETEFDDLRSSIEGFIKAVEIRPLLENILAIAAELKEMSLIDSISPLNALVLQVLIRKQRPLVIA